MAGGYFKDDQNDQMKALLYPYLMDKAKRRAEQTSGGAYQAREREYRTDEDNADARGLVSVLGDSASMAGTLQGKRSDVGMLPKFMDQLSANDQQRTDNLFKERATEEHSLGTDLNVAKFVGDEDYRDKDLKARTADRDLDRKAKLQAYLEEAKEKRDAAALSGDRFNKTYDQRERAMGNTNAIAQGRLALDRDKMNKPGAPAQDRQAAFDQRERFHNDRVGLARDRMNKSVNPNEKLTDSQRNAAMYYNNAGNALEALERMEAKGYKPGLGTALKKKLTPDGFEGYTLSPEEQSYQQAAEDYTAAKLRLESGANIPPEEIKQQARIYMILPGDSPSAIAQKKAARRSAMEGLKFKAGVGAEQIRPQGIIGDQAPESAAPPAGFSQPPGTADMVTVEAPDGSRAMVPRGSVDKYVKKGGKVVNE
jgi:hypothetical protein